MKQLEEGRPREDFYGLVYLMECPATPLSHLQGGPDKVTAQVGKPLQVTIYVTRACNLRCIHCYISAGEPLPDELSAREWESVFDQLHDLGTEDLYILGGEPMMRKDIYQLISYAAGLGMRVSMSTNGTMIGPSEARRLAGSGLAEVQVSIDGPTASVNDMIRVPGSFSAAVGAVRHLKSTGLRVTLAYVLTPLNYDKVMDFLRLAEELEVDAVTFEAVVGFGRAAANKLRLTREMGARVLRDLASYRGPVPVSLSSMRFYLPDLYGSYLAARAILGRRVERYITCPAGRTRMVIDANGDVYGCELFIPFHASEGNVRRRDITSIWREGFGWIRRRTSEAPAPCRSCPMVGLCGGGCPARAMAAHGTAWAPDPWCPILPGANALTPQDSVRQGRGA